MANSLFDPAPGFDQPIAVLAHCHDRIRRQLGTLHKLLGHLPDFGANVDAKQAATSVVRYFENAAPNHHQDEEHDLLPMLEATATNDDALLLQGLIPELLQQHQQMDVAWQVLHGQLKEIAAGASARLSPDNVNHFSSMYTAHMEQEEIHIAPMATRILSDAQMQRLGDAMRKRRGIAE
jgi:pyridoxamine 5'-phosphate oxidase